MNSANKQHRHPGLWTLPSHANAKSANDVQFAAQRQADFTTLTSTASNLMANQLAAAFTACVSDHQLTTRWVTIIGQPDSLSSTHLAALIKNSGLPAHRVRWLRPNDNESKAWAAEQALLLDNSALIIAWLGQCQPRDAQRLHLARRHTQANTLLFNDSAEKTPLH